MNIFKGARRVAAIVAPLCAIAAAVAVHGEYHDPYVSLHYEIASPLTPPKRVADCTRPSSGTTELVSRQTVSGKDYKVLLCFLPAEARDGRMLVPFKVEGDNILLGEWFTPEVRRYTEKFAREFAATDADMQEAEDVFAAARSANRVLIAAAIVCIPLLFWLFTWAIGWAVRGFLGLPRGQDYRPQASRNTTPAPAPETVPFAVSAAKSDDEFKATKELVGRLISPQVNQLTRNEEHIPVNNVTFVYILTLASCLTEKGVSLALAGRLIETLFPESSHSGIGNALVFIEHDPADFRAKCREMIPVVNAEIATGSGDFLVKYTRKLNVEIKKMFEETDFDPRTATPAHWLDVSSPPPAS